VLLHHEVERLGFASLSRSDAEHPSQVPSDSHIPRIWRIFRLMAATLRDIAA
jgi:hypothetical protein